MPTSDDFRACVCVYPGGQARRANVKCIHMMTKEQAQNALEADRAAYVPPELESEIVAYAKGVRSVIGA